MRTIILKKENIHKGNLVLINQDYTLNERITGLVSFNNQFKNIKLNVTLHKNLHLILDRIKANEMIVPVSGYRTLKQQTDIYNTSIRENGEEYTQKFVALPNTSEHQTGLAIDLALKKQNIDFICPSFPYYGICQKFREIAYKYGFIERYSEEKKNITKISKEEWHFRYVGYPHSKIMYDNNFCLEEYISYLKKFVYPNNPLNIEKYQIYYIPYKEDHEPLYINKKFTISGNNIDGFILTLENDVNV